MTIDEKTTAKSPKAVPIAALTFTYNEHVNLPLWLKHYGAICGEENLFIADRGSTDGSTLNIGKANLIKLPRNEFDEFEKTEFVNNFHSALLKFYDLVIYTDCDEFLVVDPAIHDDVRQYANKLSSDYIRAVGIDVLHIVDQEFPIDLTSPILSQRRYGRFSSAGCKALISKTPLRWLPGFHSCDRKVEIDPSLIMFHIKFMDYSIACNRQKVNIETVWSQQSLDKNFGAHHRWDMATFVHRGFFAPSDAFKRNEFTDFEFSSEIYRIASETSQANGYWHIPMDIRKFVKIPDKFKTAL